MTADLIKKLGEATEALRATAERYSTVLSGRHGDGITLRDGQADAIADFAEAVLAILSAQQKEPKT